MTSQKKLYLSQLVFLIALIVYMGATWANGIALRHRIEALEHRVKILESR